MCKTGTNPRDHFIYKTKKTLGVVSWKGQISELLILKFSHKYIYYDLTVIIAANVVPLF